MNVILKLSILNVAEKFDKSAVHVLAKVHIGVLRLNKYLFALAPARQPEIICLQGYLPEGIIFAKN